MDSLRLAGTVFQDSITRLEAANADAYRGGHDAAYLGLQDLSRRYVAELSKPRFGLRSAMGLLGAAGLGVVVGRAFR